MDNFINILVILFFVISLLAPLFKKKEEKPQTRRQPNPTPVRKPEPYNSDYTNESPDDLLGELEELFGKKRVTVEEKPAPFGEKYVPMKHQDTGIDYDNTPSYDMSGQTEIQKKKSKIEQINQETEQYLKSIKKKKESVTLASVYAKNVQNDFAKAEAAYEKKGPSNYHRNLLIDNLKNPETLKDYIIISELMGKPKALKRSR